MKRLSIVAVLLLLCAASASAHNGSLGLYTSQAATDCDANVFPFTPTNLSFMYFRSDGGPDGITGAEFMIEKSSAQVQFMSPTWNPNTVQVGDLSTGIGIGFTTECYGAGQSLIWIGTIQIFSLGAPAGWTLKVVGDPSSSEGNGLNVAICGGTKPLVPVLGGWFIAQDGACSVGVENGSWGAIKSLYDK